MNPALVNEIKCAGKGKYDGDIRKRRNDIAHFELNKREMRVQQWCIQEKNIVCRLNVGATSCDDTFSMK